MQKPIWLSGYRLFFGLLVFVGIGALLIHVHDDGTLNWVNFFSYFTILSNILAAIVLILGAVTPLGSTSSKAWDMFRGGVMLYMAMTGVVYGLLLAGYEVDVQTNVDWVNNVVHRIVPLVMVIDWLIDPPKRRITFRQGLVWISFPIAFVMYTLIRGPRVDWYPYPFLDPNETPGGYFGVAAYCVGISIGVLGFIWVATWFTTWRVKGDAVTSGERLSAVGE